MQENLEALVAGFKEWDGVTLMLDYAGWDITAFWSQFAPVQKYEFNSADAQTKPDPKATSRTRSPSLKRPLLRACARVRACVHARMRAGD